MVDGRDSAWRNRAPGPHAHRNTARQAMDGLWTEVCGQQKQQQPAQPPIRQLLGAADVQTAHRATFSTAPTHQLLGPANAETTTPAGAPAAAADRTQRRATQHAKGRTGDRPGPRKETTARRNVTQGVRRGLRTVPANGSVWAGLFLRVGARRPAMRLKAGNAPSVEGDRLSHPNLFCEAPTGSPAVV